MTRPQDLYADEFNRLMRIAWANPERHNAAYPDDLIDPTTQSMPVFVADQGYFVNGVKVNYPYPDIPEDYIVPAPPEWSLPLVDKSVPLELDGKPMQINPKSAWPVGYRRQKDRFTLFQEIVYLSLAVVGVPWFLSKPGAQGWAYIIMLVLLVNISWLEWSSRCEDRVRVQRVAIAYNAALAAWAVHQHREAQQRQETRAIESEQYQQQRREDQAKFEAQQAENRRLEEVAHQRWINHRDNGGPL